MPITLQHASKIADDTSQTNITEYKASINPSDH